MLVSFSFNILSDFYPLGFIARFETSTLFDLVLTVSIDWLLPLGALLVVVFFAYCVDRGIVLDELGWKENRATRLLYLHAKVLIPLAIVAMVVFG